jgi:hypothetical protein
MPAGTDTMRWIHHTEVPVGRTVTYSRVGAELKPLKEEKERIRVTVGGDKIGTETADLTTAKILFNSIGSMDNARFATADISNFYLNNPMERFEYMRIPIRDIPPDIFSQYALTHLAVNGHVTVEISKGMYGLPQEGIIANTRLKAHLAGHG